MWMGVVEFPWASVASLWNGGDQHPPARLPATSPLISAVRLVSAAAATRIVCLHAERLCVHPVSSSAAQLLLAVHYKRITDAKAGLPVRAEFEFATAQVDNRYPAADVTSIIMTNSVAGRVSWISQNLQATQELLQDTILDTKYVCSSDIRHIRWLKFDLAGSRRP